MVEWIALVVAGLALLTSAGQWFAAATANLLSASDPWANRVLDYVVKAITLAFEDAERFRNFYTVPFEDVESKNARKRGLFDNRDNEDRNLATLTQLIDDSTITELKAQRDRIEDSYLQNLELALKQKISAALLEQYNTAAQRYIDALRDLSHSLSQTRRRMLKKAKSRMKGRGKISPAPSRGLLGSGDKGG